MTCWMKILEAGENVRIFWAKLKKCQNWLISTNLSDLKKNPFFPRHFDVKTSWEFSEIFSHDSCGMSHFFDILAYNHEQWRTCPVLKFSKNDLRCQFKLNFSTWMFTNLKPHWKVAEFGYSTSISRLQILIR